MVLKKESVYAFEFLLELIFGLLVIVIDFALIIKAWSLIKNFIGKFLIIRIIFVSIYIGIQIFELFEF